LIVGVLSAALSTFSSCLNSLSGIIYEDCLKRFIPNLDEKRASNILKIIVVVLGAISYGQVFFIKYLGGVFSIALAFVGITGGPSLALFTYGMLSRKFNKFVSCGI
jgi:sodium-coupled monocarboxylate transporter 8/12